MKKYIGLWVFPFLIAGCTDPEQDTKIHQFWTDQVVQVIQKTVSASVGEVPLQEEETEEMDPNFKPIEVLFFMHPQAPTYLQLQQDHWLENFQQQYAGKVNVTQFDVSTATGQTSMRRFMHMRNLSSLTVPALVIGNKVLQNYPFENVDQTVQAALEAPVVMPIEVMLAAPQESPVKQRPKPVQFMEITLEEDTPPVSKINTKAPDKDKAIIQRALENARAANQKTLKDIGKIFGSDTQAEAYGIVSKTEKLLQNTAQTSESAQKYLTVQEKILQQQEQMLNKVMQSHAKNLRAIRG